MRLACGVLDEIAGEGRPVAERPSPGVVLDIRTREPTSTLRVSGSAVDAYSPDAQVGDAHDRTQWDETAVSRRVQKLPTFILTGQQWYGTNVTDQLKRQPRADTLEVCQNGQDRSLDLAKGGKAFCVVPHEPRGLPETRGDQGLGCGLGLIEQNEVAAPLHPSCVGVECPSPVQPDPREDFCTGGRGLAERDEDENPVTVIRALGQGVETRQQSRNRRRSDGSEPCGLENGPPGYLLFHGRTSARKRVKLAGISV